MSVLVGVGLWGCGTRCPDDGAFPEDDGVSSTTETMTSITTFANTSTDDDSGSAETSSSGPGDSGSSDDGLVDSSSSDSGPACDPPVVGEWNACIGPDGSTDNQLCNYMGHPDNTGFIGCLTSSELEGGNVCFISGCRDTCDCFDPPATGTAEVICAEILADGGTGCALDCSAGQTCPDGMVCAGNICFWPPA